MLPKFKIFGFPEFRLGFQTGANGGERRRAALFCTDFCLDSAGFRVRFFRSRQVFQTQLFAVFSASVFCHDAAEGKAVLLFHEDKAVPVRRTVMMRLGNAETVDFDFQTA